MKLCDHFLKKHKIKILIIVRLNSTRLQNKAKLKINNLSIVEILIRRLLSKFNNSNIIICSSYKSKSKFFENLKKKYKIKIFYGNEKNIFKRILDCQKKFFFKHFIRITGDNPLTDLDTIFSISKKHIRKKNDFTYTEGLPRGLKPEIYSISALQNCFRMALDPNSSEYLTYFFKRNEFKYSYIKIKKNFSSQTKLSITIDSKKDYLNLKKLISKEGIYAKRLNIIGFLKKNKIYSNKIYKKTFKLKTRKYDVRFVS